MDNDRKDLKHRSSEKKTSKKHNRVVAITVVALVCVAFAVVFITVIIPKQKLTKGMEMLESGDYEMAYAILEEIGKDDIVAENKLERAIGLIDSGDLEGAQELLKGSDSSDIFMSMRYDRAIAFIESENYEAAYILLSGLDYKDSAVKLASIKSQYQNLLLTKAQVGSFVTFGVYEQDNDSSDGKEDIEWLVLEKYDNKILLISRYALDYHVYDPSFTSVTWENCSVRNWLNDEFISDAFSVDEQNLIQVTTVTADKNPYFPSTDAGNDTSDKVFLLSISEAHNLFASNKERQCKETEYCNAQGSSADDNGNCMWWLRTPGKDSNYAMIIGNDGSALQGGASVDHPRCAVRPAVWVSLNVIP